MHFTKNSNAEQSIGQETRIKCSQAGRIIAAPSWVFPGTIAENCNFLAGKVNEVALLFMESSAASAYTASELPAELANLPLIWHVHLPTDLNWVNPREAAKLCIKLMDKVQYLGAKRGVLHPPVLAVGSANKQPTGLATPQTLTAAAGQATEQAKGHVKGQPLPQLTKQITGQAAVLVTEQAAMQAKGHVANLGTDKNSALFSHLESFVLHWEASGRKSQDILLENLPHSDLPALLGIAERLDVSLCLDLAHLIMSGGELPKGYMNRVGLLHLCAPAQDQSNGQNTAQGKSQGHHHPLTNLNAAGLALGAKICQSAKKDTVFMLELFSWQDFTASLPILNAWME